jgi:NAD(P)-dependent dehydrogenase (short-subunit alcohol dehydrogenase family)
VGMICPGLHSLFAAFAVELVDGPRDQDGIGFRVSATDERFRMIKMNVAGSGISGSVQAFLRWPPIEQASLREIVKIVAPTEFVGGTALIIGGSRGLGALTAKIIAAGGGKVVVTYATGRTEAEQLAQEIRNNIAHDACRVIPYDARQDAANQLGNLNADVSHLYYFATTPIARQKEALFVADLLDEFVEVYVKGFYDCCRFLGGHGSQVLTVFYPSSVFVENTPAAMTEYSMAKMAGEVLCASMNRSNASVRVIVSRLPRLLTDQTATVLPVETGDPLEVMLPIIRRVQSSRFGA